MSHHSYTLYKGGVLGKQGGGAQIHYSTINDRTIIFCQAVCAQIAIEADLQ